MAALQVAVVVLFLVSGGRAHDTGGQQARRSSSAAEASQRAAVEAGSLRPWFETRQLHTGPTGNSGLILPLQGPREGPTGYLVRRRPPRRPAPSARTEYSATLLFSGRCAAVRRADLRAVSRSFKRLTRQLHRQLALEAHVVSFMCLYQLRLNLTLPLVGGQRRWATHLPLLKGHNLTIMGEQFPFHTVLFGGHTPLMKKPDPVNSSKEVITFFLFVVGLCCVVVVTSMVVAECFLCVRRLVLAPPLLDLGRYSEDEVPRCMRDQVKARAKATAAPGHQPVPSFLPMLQQDAAKAALSRGDGARDGDALSDDVSFDSSDWSTEVEYPRYRDEPPVYASVSPSDGRGVKTVTAPQSQADTTARNDRVEADGGCVALHQRQTLNSDYDQVPCDSDEESHGSERLQRDLRVARERDRPTLLETDM